MNKMRYIVSLAALMMGASASAVLISSESFSVPGAYADGAKLGLLVAPTTGNYGFTSNFGWNGGTALLKTQAGGLTHNGIAGTASAGSVLYTGAKTVDSEGAPTGPSAKAAFRKLVSSSITGSSFFLSGLVSSDGLRAGDQYVMGVGEYNSVIAMDFLKGFHLGLSADLSGDVYLTAYAAGNVYTLGSALTPTQLSGTSLIVLKAELGAGTGDDTLTAWYVLDGETELSSAETWSNLTIVDSAGDLEYATAAAKAIVGNTGYDTGNSIDEMRFGTTLQDVTSIPDPYAPVVIAEYGFDSDSAVSSDTQTQTTAANLSRGSSVSSFSYSTLDKAGGKAIYFNDDGFDATNEVSAAANYLAFEVSVDPGPQVSYSTLTFYTLRRAVNDEGLGAPDHFAVYAVQAGDTNAVGGGTIPLAALSSYTKQTVDLSAVASLQEVTATTEFRIVMWASQGTGTSTQRTFRVDEFSLEGVILDASSYQIWSATYGLTGADAELAANPDHDSMDNLVEYGFGGNPSNASDSGIRPVSSVVNENGTNYFQVVYRRRTDAAARNLSYDILYDENLTSLPEWTNGFVEVDSGPLEPGFEAVTNRIATGDRTQEFGRIQVEISNQ